ncbi:MAG: TetR/AcrR family transcriptional regulator [Halanaerobiales bacterium]|nr:TetR/AcrR family transcriptional regulator [Halanaerobiales bacterium]
MSKEKENLDNNSLKAEERILKAATEVFAEKGYDAAGIDEIAKRANVTKPLIYYYFKGKRTILEEVINRYLKKVVEEKEEYINSMLTFDKEMLYQRFDQRVGIFRENKKVLQVIAMEMLKENAIDDSIISNFYQMYDLALPRIEKMGFELEDQLDIIITSFFFGTLPTMLVTLLGDKFCQFYNLEREELDQRFFKAMKAIYIDYIIEYFQKKIK